MNPSEAPVPTGKERGWLQALPRRFGWQGSWASINQTIDNAVSVEMVWYVAEVLLPLRRSDDDGTDKGWAPWYRMQHENSPCRRADPQEPWREGRILSD